MVFSGGFSEHFPTLSPQHAHEARTYVRPGAGTGTLGIDLGTRPAWPAEKVA